MNVRPAKSSNKQMRIESRYLHVLLILLTPILACREETPHSPRPVAEVPIFVISIDTLRSDHVGAYGYTKETTPAIDSFREEGVLFRKAYSPVPLTLPSHASLLTGLYPYQHGVRDNLGYLLPAERATLPSILAARGYATGAAVSSFVIRGDTGMARGFDSYDDFMTYTAHDAINSWQRPGDVSRDILGKWLDATRSTKVFGFLHIYEPHSPYTPPEPFASAFDDPYDGEVAAADAVVRNFLDDLRSRGLYDNALIVLMSDHGEGLGDHGEAGHGVFLYREAIQVPLIIKLPGGARAGEEIAEPVSIVDIMPTVLSRGGVVPPNGLPGVDLFSSDRTVFAERLIYGESYYPRIQYGWHEIFSLIDARHHYIDAPRVELYDLEEDPVEQKDLANENRRLVAARREEVRTIVLSHPFKLPTSTDPEDVAKLAALGYLGGGTLPATGSLPDAKDKLDLLQLLGEGAGFLQSGEYERAVEIGKAIVSDNPDFMHGWGLLSSAYQKMDKLDLALGTLQEQMKRSPGNPHTALWIASLYLKRGDYAQAKNHAELALAASPQFAHEMLADVALSRNDLVAAENEANQALRIAPTRVQPILVISQVRQRQHRFAEELSLLDRARESVEYYRLPPIRDLEHRRGQALLQLGRVSEAEAAFRAETEAFPSSTMSWADLALVVAGQGRPAEATQILALAVEKNPTPEMRRIAAEARSLFERSGE